MYTPFTSPHHYYSKEIYELEKEAVFSKTWQFACFLEQVKEHNDFVTFSLGGKEIVVQNFQGSIKAFLNVCAHRYAKIQTEPQGSRLLSCPYHGWTYNKEGVPIGIPCKEEFDKIDPKQFALKKYHVEVLGQIVFINLSENPSSLSAYLGDFFPRMKSMAEALGNIKDIYEIDVDCNWKVAVENSLEAYHLGIVHPDSISQYFKSEELSSVFQERAHTFSFCFPHSYLMAPVSKSEAKGWKKIKPLLGEFALSFDGYTQNNVFPNFNIASFHGSCFFFQVFRPTSFDKVKITHYCLESLRHNTTVKSDILYDSIMEGSVLMGKKILNEDISICIKVQSGVDHASNKGVLSMEEERVLHHQRAYMEFLGNASELKTTSQLKMISQP